MSKYMQKITSLIVVFFFTCSQLAWSAHSVPIQFDPDYVPTTDASSEYTSDGEDQSQSTTTDFLSESDSPLSAATPDETQSPPDTAPPELTILSPKSLEVTPDTTFTVYGAVTDQSQVEEVSVYVYDFGRLRYTVTGAKAHYNPGEGTWSFEVLPDYVSIGQATNLLIQAKDEYGNWSSLQGIQIFVGSPSEPEVTIAIPASGVGVSDRGFTFEGTASDPTGIEEVRVYVFDEARGYFTVVNRLADYDPSTNTWSFQVDQSQITLNSNVRLLVRAKDKEGAWSNWDRMTLPVEDFTSPEGTISINGDNA